MHEGFEFSNAFYTNENIQPHSMFSRLFIFHTDIVWCFVKYTFYKKLTIQASIYRIRHPLRQLAASPWHQYHSSFLAWYELSQLTIAHLSDLIAFYFKLQSSADSARHNIFRLLKNLHSQLIFYSHVSKTA